MKSRLFGSLESLSLSNARRANVASPWPRVRSICVPSSGRLKFPNKSWQSFSRFGNFTARCYTERRYATVCRLSVSPSVSL